jgi:rfaE bifunctional protein kinase chain/domain/rfaE bifunctional protein nucleotidyltransferase chain/domain
MPATRASSIIKIHELDALAVRVRELKAQGKRVVHCHGVFDLLHVGHIKHLEEARSMGDVLVVTLTPDRFVNKGPHRPAFPEALRLEAIAGLEAVDFVAVNKWPTAVEVITLLQPSVYVKGPDYKEAAKDITGGITREEEAVRAGGGVLVFTESETFSSSAIINRHLPLFGPAVSAYLDAFRHRHDAGELIGHLDSLRSLRVLIVGESIIDEYVYCDALGKSSKEPVLVMKYVSREQYAGGSLAVANHIASFCDRVQLLSYIGAENSHEAFIRSRLEPQVTPTFVTKAGSPTIVKRRFLDRYSSAKLSAVYEFNDQMLAADEESQVLATLDALLPQVDLVIASDFGHGLITQAIADRLADKAPFLVVNAQINAANVGFHTISKYKRADYVCIHEGEIRLDTRSRSGELRSLVADVARRLSCGTMMITRGQNGTLVYRGGEFVDGPALATRIVDRIGAGDAVLAITALSVARGVEPDILAFIGNLVGAQAVGIVGNRTFIDRVALIRSIESLLK